MGGHNGSSQSEVETIQKKAYELWEKDGRPEGRDLDYWLRAESAVKTRNINKNSKIPGIKRFTF